MHKSQKDINIFPLFPLTPFPSFSLSPFPSQASPDLLPGRFDIMIQADREPN
jgi:hypothetical protein